MLETKVGAFLSRHLFSLENKKMVVGVSGGPDSLALLHYLWGLKDKNNLSLVVAHVDHMFRGEESYEDAMFVKNYCDDNSIPFEMCQIDVPNIMAETGKSAEVAGREARYRFFAQVMDDYQYPFLALAHHGDDQIETIMMRLTRGSTGKARAGMQFKRPFHNGTIFRPFLCMTKSELKQYCQEQHLEPRFDPSNEQSIYSRNRFRKVVLPFLKAENRQVHDHFQRLSEEMIEDETFLQELTVQRMNTVIKKRERQQIIIDIDRFLEMPMPLQRRGIQLILNYLYNERPASLSAVHIDQVFSLLHHPQPSGKLDFPNGLKVIRSYRELIFQFGVMNKQTFQFELTVPGTVSLPGNRYIKMEYMDTPSPVPSPYTAVFDTEKVQIPLIIRTREAGDRMSLKGRSGTKKLKDIFIDLKVPIPKRDEWPVVTDKEGGILWIPGLKKSALEGTGHTTGCYIQLTYYNE